MAIEHLQINQIKKNDEYSRNIIFWLQIIAVTNTLLFIISILI